MESLPSTRQPWITFFYCTEFLTYENLIKGEETESLRYIWVGLNMTIQLYSSTKLKEKSVPPFVKWEITPASTIPEEPNSPLVIMPETPSTIHLAMMKPSFVHKHFSPRLLDIMLVIQVVKPARQGSSGIFVPHHYRSEVPDHTSCIFTFRLIGVKRSQTQLDEAMTNSV